MLVLRLIPSLCRWSLPMLLHTFFISILYSFNLIWINNKHRDSMDIISGYAFAQSLFIAIFVSLLVSTAKPLYTFTLMALSHGHFTRVGIFLQRSFLITHLMFVLLALLLYWSDPLLSFILRSLETKVDDINITITSNTLKILMVAAYSLCVYYNIVIFLVTQSLVRYALCCIVGFGIFVQYFVLVLFDNNSHDHYTDDVAALSITFGVQCVVIIALSVLYCCGCYQSSLKSRILSIAQRQSTQNTEDDTYKYLLEKKDYEQKHNLNNQQSKYNKGGIYSKGSIHTIHSISSSYAYNTFTNSKPTYDALQQASTPSPESTSTLSTVTWFHLPTWSGWNFIAMCNGYAIHQFTKCALKEIFIHSFHGFIVYFILIFVPSIINFNSFVAQLLCYNIFNLFIVIPTSLSYALYQLITIKLDEGARQSYRMYINNLWDTVICLWLFIISMLITIIYFCTDHIIKLYLPLPPALSTANDDVRIYEMIYNDLKNVSIPWMCLFLILYGLIIINLSIFKCIDSEVTSYGALNAFVFLIVGIPMCFWLISTDYHIPNLLTSLNGVWFSLCWCCVIILLYAAYKRCNIDWEHECKLYLNRKLTQKRQYRYDVQLQARYSCSGCSCCCSRKPKQIYDEDLAKPLGNAAGNCNIKISNKYSPNESPQNAQITKQKQKKKRKHSKKISTKRRQLKQLRSWSEMEANPFQASDFEIDKNGEESTTKADDTLILKTDSEEEETEDSSECDTLEKYGDPLVALDDDDEISSSVEMSRNDNKIPVCINMNINRDRRITETPSRYCPSDTSNNDDDDNSVSTMDSGEVRQMLNDLQQSDSSFIAESQIVS